MNVDRRMTKLAIFGLSCALLMSFFQPSRTVAQEGGDSPEAVVRKLYDLVTFGAGERPDWGQVRSTFVDEAIIVLRTSRDSTSVFSLDAFVDDFVRFIEGSNAKEVGFEEKILRMNSMVFGDMASILVLYEAHIPGSPRAPQKGVDSMLLSRRGGEWKIVAITNEIPTPERPVPEELRD